MSPASSVTAGAEGWVLEAGAGTEWRVIGNGTPMNDAQLVFYLGQHLKRSNLNKWCVTAIEYGCIYLESPVQHADFPKRRFRLASSQPST